MKRIFFIPIISIFLLSSCNQGSTVVEDSEAFKADYAKWQSQRIDRLKAETGWLNLAGLYWLEEGVNTIGSDSSNTILFPEHYTAFGGEIILSDSTISFNGSGLRHDQQENTTVISHETFRWFIIKRGETYGIRLRDLEHPRLEELDHIPAYPLSEEWVIEAEFFAYDSVRTVEVPTVIANFSEYYDVPGELRFRKKGKTYALIPFAAGKGYFLIIGDATNGMETYGAGRFMYTDQVDGNKVILDFNRATNPPCAFSPYATCPLPPMENILDLEIEAGEKGVHLE